MKKILNVLFILFLLCSLNFISSLSKKNLKNHSLAKTTTENNSQTKIDAKNKSNLGEKTDSKLKADILISDTTVNLKEDTTPYENSITSSNDGITGITNDQDNFSIYTNQISGSIPSFITNDSTMKKNYDTLSTTTLSSVSTKQKTISTTLNSKLTSLKTTLESIKTSNLIKLSLTDTFNYNSVNHYKSLNEQLFYYSKNGKTDSNLVVISSTGNNYDIKTLDGVKNAKHSARMTAACLSGVLSALPPSFCQKNSGDAGTVPTKCIDGWTRFGALCYKNCKDGYKLVWGVCWETCKKHYKELGIGCYKAPFSFYFKKSYVTSTATNFENEATCQAGMYKNGALCYRDCNNIGMSNCGLGFCSADETACSLGITQMVFDITYGVAKLCAFALSFGASSAGTTAVDKLKSSMTTSMKSRLKTIFKSIKKSLIRTFYQRSAKRNAAILISKINKGGVISATLGSVCYEVTKGIVDLADSKTEPGFDYSLLDPIGLTSAITNCESIKSKNDSLSCAASILNTMNLIDPTGVLTIASAVLQPQCEVPDHEISLEPDSGCFRFYDDIDFSGDYRDECFSKSSITYFGKTSSVKLSENVTVTLYTEANYSGTSVVLESDYLIADLSYYISQVRSFKVLHGSPASGCAVLFEDCNYTGNSFQICSSAATLPLSINISSVKTSDTTPIQLYSEEDYGGSSKVIGSNSSTSCLNTVSFNDKTKSILFIPQAETGCIVLYEDCDFKGNKWTYCDDVSEVKISGDNPSSFIIGLGTQGVFYLTAGYKGDYFQMNENAITCIKDDYPTFNDKIKSISIKNLKPSDGCVLLFEQCNFGGISKELCQSSDSIKHKDGSTIFDFSSMIIGKNVEDVYLIDGSSYKGKKITSQVQQQT